MFVSLGWRFQAAAPAVRFGGEGMADVTLHAMRCSADYDVVETLSVWIKLDAL